MTDCLTIPSAHPPRVLMTLDAVGGVWRYAIDLARGLRDAGCGVTLAGFGPRPEAAKQQEAEAVGTLDWCDAPLDWMCESEAQLRDVPAEMKRLIRTHRPDVVQVNYPSQAARLDVQVPVVAVSHSCVATWFAAVRGTELPTNWQWQARLNRAGFDRADAVVAPSRAHAALMERTYGPITELRAVHNATSAPEADGPGGERVIAMGRWWDDGKDGATLDAAAGMTGWPVTMLGATTGGNGTHLDVRNAEAPGEMDHARALDHLRHAGAFVAPSIHEPFGLAVAEAARAGLPLVLSDIPTFRELWHGAAVFVPPRDPTALADALNHLAAAPERRRALGTAARTRAARYTPAAQTHGMLDLYATLPATEAA